jgi:hypothetical protein
VAEGRGRFEDVLPVNFRFFSRTCKTGVDNSGSYINFHIIGPNFHLFPCQHLHGGGRALAKPILVLCSKSKLQNPRGKISPLITETPASQNTGLCVEWRGVGRMWRHRIRTSSSKLHHLLLPIDVGDRIIHESLSIYWSEGFCAM